MTDNVLVTNHRDDDPIRSDSVELFVDVRAPWKHYMKGYSPGAFKIVFVPADGKSKATFRYEGTPFGSVARLDSKKTAGGYRLEADIHFHQDEVEDPGWVEKRPVRVGVLVHDSDDPAGKHCKATLGLWRTAANVGEDCTSMTTFITEKSPAAAYASDWSNDYVCNLFLSFRRNPRTTLPIRGPAGCPPLRPSPTPPSTQQFGSWGCPSVERFGSNSDSISESANSLESPQLG